MERVTRMGHGTESLASRLTGFPQGAPGEVRVEKETTRVPEEHNPFGIVLQKLMDRRGLSQAGLARKMQRAGYPRTATRITIVNAMGPKAEGITFAFVDYVCRVLELTPEEDSELWAAARETKRL